MRAGFPRVIFVLLYERGRFVLSRNFRLQMVGTIEWLFDNYDFAQVSRGLDEIMILDVSREGRDVEAFSKAVALISSRCFVPMTVGGGVISFDIARAYMRAGADKLLVNSAFASDSNLCLRLANYFGRQCIVGGVDFKGAESSNRTVFIQNGTKTLNVGLGEWVRSLQQLGAGEIVLQSIERDGTGTGLDMSVAGELRQVLEVPCILLGGVGKGEHIVQGLQSEAVDAVATANLFNFVGATFLRVRELIAASGVVVPRWSGKHFDTLRGRFAPAAW